MAREEYPEIGSRVMTPAGEGRTTGMNIFRHTVYVELKDTRQLREFPVEEVSQV